MYSTYLMKSGFCHKYKLFRLFLNNIWYRNRSLLNLEEKMCWLFTVTGRLSAPDETPKHNPFCILMFYIFPSNHQFFLEKNPRWLPEYMVPSLFFFSLSLNVAVILHVPPVVRPQYCPWTKVQHDNTHINKAQMEKHLKKKKTIEGQSGTRFGTGKGVTKGNKHNKMAFATSW